MKLHSISIKGWRSFEAESGISLNDLAQANLIIGPNNVGKSNVVRFFKWIREILLTNNQWHQATNARATMAISCALPEGDCWLRTASIVEATLTLNWDEAANTLPEELVWSDNLVKAHI